MKLPDAWARATPIFDDDTLVSFAGLAPVMALGSGLACRGWSASVSVPVYVCP